MELLIPRQIGMEHRQSIKLSLLYSTAAGKDL